VSVNEVVSHRMKFCWYDCMLRDLTRSRPRDTDAHLYLQHEKVHMKRYNHAREGIHHAKQKWYFCM